MDHCFVSAIWRFLCASIFLVGITVLCQAAEIYVAKFPFSELSLSICGRVISAALNIQTACKHKLWRHVSGVCNHWTGLLDWTTGL